MARGVNKVLLIGHVGQAPELRYMPNGSPVVNLTLATTEVWKDRGTGETKESTEWHRLVFYRRLAEVVQAYAKKGSRLYIEGRLRTRKWQDQNGQDRYTTEIQVDEMQLLDSRRADTELEHEEAGSAKERRPQGTALPAGSAIEQLPASPFDDEDDIPF